MKRATFLLKIPQAGRRSFSILQRNIDGKARKLDSKEIDSINLSYQQGRVSFEDALKFAKEVRKKLYGNLLEPERRTFNSENERILERFWKTKYEHRPIIDKASAYNDFVRAVRAVASLPLQTASQQQLQKIVKNLPQQRRIVSRINSILRFLNRDILLQKNHSKAKRIRHLTLNEFNQISKRLPTRESMLIAATAFFAGLRTGEIFYLNYDNYRENFILVDGQMDRQGLERETKTRRQRRAFIIPEGRDLVMEWCKFSQKGTLRGTRISQEFKTICLSVFPSEKQKWCSIHDLRHSYAIHLVGKGVPISLVSQSLGNSVLVCQEYYSGYSITDEGILTIEQTLSR